jgi:hypothetical protein
MVDYSMLSKKPNLTLAKTALALGMDIQKKKDSLPEAQQRVYALSLAASVADSYLRIAKMRESDPKEADALIVAAIEQLKVAAETSESVTAQWTLFRLADLELGRSNAGASLEWLTRAYRDLPTPFLAAFDESYLPFGILIEKPAQRCALLNTLMKGSAAGNAVSALLLIDVLRRSGDVPGAKAAAVSLRNLVESPTKWFGSPIRQKLLLLEAKLKLESGNSLTSEVLSQQFDSLGHENEFLKFDIYELAEIIRDENLLTKLRAAILFPPSHASLAPPCG